jgi:hypothetical protein
VDSAQFINAVMEELQHIPTERLPELYHLLHAFRLQVESAADRDPMRFAGCWNDLPDETYADLMTDIATRRQQAFSERRTHEASLD